METNLNNFKNYCERNQNVFTNGLGCSEAHNHLVRKILNDPHLLNLKRVLFRYKEVDLFSKEGGGRIDLVFITDEEIPYICEFKSSSRAGRGIEAQLERYYTCIRKKFQITPIRIGVQLTEMGRIKKKIIPVEIKDLLQRVSIGEEI
jgi:hypothetical protein